MLESLEKLYRGETLSLAESQALFEVVLRGEMDPVILSSLLTALKIKGEAPSEIAGAACALLAAAKPFPRPDYDFCDIVGTGGDGQNTINVSTLAALTGSCCDIKIAKHGNRSVSSKTGSSDLLDKLGIKLDMSPEQARRCLDQVNVTFIFAPVYHSSFRHAMPVRQALRTRTIFNVLGPLINPARPTYQLMGVYNETLLAPIAETLVQLGLERGMVVHGQGLDEIAIHGSTQVAQISHGSVLRMELSPADFGLQQYPLSAIRGGEPEENRQISEAILAGKGSDAQNSAIAINLAPLLLMGGKVENLKQGAELAIATLKSGKPLEQVQKLAALSHQQE